MPQDVDEIRVGANGAVRAAPLGTAIPATPIASPAAGWVDLGLVSEDGVSFKDARTLKEISVWQMFYTARRIITGRDLTVKFVLRQWNRDTVPLAFGGGSVTTTAGPPAHYTYEPPDPEVIDERMLMVDWLDGDHDYRLILRRGMVTEDVETKLVRTDPADLPITFGVNGVAGVKPWSLLTNDPAFAAA
jgi:hypothetical protein